MATNLLDEIFADAASLERLQAVIQRRIGVNVSGKESLLRQRLRKLFANGELQSLDHLVRELEHGQRLPNLLSRVVDRVTTHHTYFYREPPHFHRLKEIVQQHPPGRKLRIWSAACSTGEEAYTIAMVLGLELGLERLADEVAILGTDVSQASIDEATRARYAAKSIERLPREYRGCFRVHGQEVSPKEHYRDICMFRKLNLLLEKYPFKRGFDVIFCRNVFIYFDRPTQQAIASRMAQLVPEGGYLFLSQTETLRDAVVPFDRVGPGIYRRYG